MKFLFPVFALFLFCKLCIAEEDFRTWTSSDGRKIEAKFLRYSGNEIVIKRTDGKEFTISPELLVDDDRKYLEGINDKIISSKISSEKSGEFFKGSTLVVSLEGEVKKIGFSKKSSSSKSDVLETSEDEIRAGDFLSIGSKIEVGVNSEVILLFSSGTITRVGQNTKFWVKEFLQKDFNNSEKEFSDLTDEVSMSTIFIELETGDLIVDVKKLNKDSTFEINTKLGVAGIRGTSFRIICSEDRSILTVLSGKVNFKSVNQNEILALSNKVVTKEKNKNPLVSELGIQEREKIAKILEMANEEAKGISLSTMRSKLGAKLRIHTVPSAENMEMIWVEKEDRGRRNQLLARGFFLGKYEVTQSQYAKVRSNISTKKRYPSKFNGNPNYPVESISYSDAKAFILRLNFLEKDNLPKGWQYTLPTTRQLELVSFRKLGHWWWGKTFDPKFANFKESGINKTHEVGHYPPNPLGFHDIEGNVFEFTLDKDIHGGSWFSPATPTNPLLMNPIHIYTTTDNNSENGFRVALCRIK